MDTWMGQVYRGILLVNPSPKHFSSGFRCPCTSVIYSMNEKHSFLELFFWSLWFSVSLRFDRALWWFLPLHLSQRYMWLHHLFPNVVLLCLSQWLVSNKLETCDLIFFLKKHLLNHTGTLLMNTSGSNQELSTAEVASESLKWENAELPNFFNGQQ